MRPLMRFPGAKKRDDAVARWFSRETGLVTLARIWFDTIRSCGDDVKELLHDGQPTACVEDAAFAYVDAFTAHVNVGFFHGAALPDAQGLLVGTGKYMRHVKVRPDAAVNENALAALITCAYVDVKERLENERQVPT
jgi:hypothetical protein